MTCILNNMSFDLRLTPLHTESLYALLTCARLSVSSNQYLRGEHVRSRRAHRGRRWSRGAGKPRYRTRARPSSSSACPAQVAAERLRSLAWVLSFSKSLSAVPRGSYLTRASCAESLPPRRARGRHVHDRGRRRPRAPHPDPVRAPANHRARAGPRHGDGARPRKSLGDVVSSDGPGRRRRGARRAARR